MDLGESQSRVTQKPLANCWGKAPFGSFQVPDLWTNGQHCQHIWLLQLYLWYLYISQKISKNPSDKCPPFLGTFECSPESPVASMASWGRCRNSVAGQWTLVSYVAQVIEQKKYKERFPAPLLSMCQDSPPSGLVWFGSYFDTQMSKLMPKARRIFWRHLPFLWSSTIPPKRSEGCEALGLGTCKLSAASMSALAWD